MLSSERKQLFGVKNVNISLKLFHTKWFYFRYSTVVIKVFYFYTLLHIFINKDVFKCSNQDLYCEIFVLYVWLRTHAVCDHFLCILALLGKANMMY